MSTFKAGVYAKNKMMQVVDKPFRALKPGEARLKMICCGICHTDVHLRDGDFGDCSGKTAGHEGIGIVEEVAPGVTSLKVGDRASVAWLYSACGHCEFCVSGQEAVCHELINSGLQVDGGLAEQCYVKADYAVKVPEKLDSGVASSVTCAGVTVYKAIKLADLRPGKICVLFGLGGLGNLSVQVAKSFGATIVAVDINDKQLAFAKECGADYTINSANEDVIKVLNEKFGGAHSAVVTATAPIAFKNAILGVRAMGRVVCVGLPSKPLELALPDLVLRGIQMIGSIVGTRQDLAEAFELAAEGIIKPKCAPRKLEETQEIMEEMMAGKFTGRMVVYF